MKCVNHSDKDAAVVCNYCGKSICGDCQVILKEESYCKECLSIKVGKEKKEERSPALAAILSFVIGGLGQIYNGQIGKGILIFFTTWLIVPWIIGIVDAYKTAKLINEGKLVVKSKPGCLIAFVIGVAILFIGVVFLGMLAAIAIPNLLRARLAANESAVKARLQSVSSLIEGYRVANNGVYPLNESSINLPESYNNRLINGYVFSEEFRADGYKIAAAPSECGITGSKVFTIDQNGALNSSDCQENPEGEKTNEK